MKLTVDLKERSYDITIGKNLLSDADKYFNLDRKVLIVTDDNIPSEYSEKIKGCSKNGIIKVIPNGEKSKSFEGLETLLKTMLDNGFSRKDCVVAVGGGVVGDLAGFAAATYMRGIDFYNAPTTVLSQVDSSIGGKVAVNFCGVKNIVGAFYQPKAVLIDTETLSSLPDRQIKNGLMEALKSGAIKDKELFEMFENTDKPDITQIIYKSLTVKKKVVENDEKEKGERMLLNFGHTIGHGIEVAADGRLFHGEAVALGMYLISDDTLRDRLKKIYSSLGMWENLKTVYTDLITNKADTIKSAILHDKKAADGVFSAVVVENIGDGKIKKMTAEEIDSLIGGLK